ncbi:PQQ-dependent sugar dehydrogenase [Streptomyces sp. NPDC016566]|uniref:PQQ-dependent sugar dehydrogenase n=1 Tax=Streptomyces sp. NPDC016566 TaxID=3364967 RepID=UPI0036FC5061
MYSYALRNPEGLAWDARGRMWGADIGHTEWDELNLVSKGRNYGWPSCEGACSTAGTTTPRRSGSRRTGGCPPRSRSSTMPSTSSR